MSETDAAPSRAKENPSPAGTGGSTDAGSGPNPWAFGDFEPLNEDRTDLSIDLPRYTMGHRFRGQALIFNNGTFKYMAHRPGTERDVVHLRTCLTKLGFDVKLKNDATNAEIKDRILKAAAEDHSQSDCFLCVFLSHGDDGVVYGKDSRVQRESTHVRLQEDVFDKFRGENCQSLVGKPKIFIVQACRGAVFEEGVIEADCVTVDARTADPEVEEGNAPTIPSGADFIICYSTSQGFFSFRNSANGSWYIVSLCKQLGVFAHQEDFTKILTRVHHQVSQRSSQSSNPTSSGKKQMPCYISMLTKQLYLRPRETG